MKKTWNIHEAISLCRQIEEIAPNHGCHVALTGGCLYKDGERKDLDLVFYRIRQADCIETGSLRMALAEIGIQTFEDRRCPWIVKASMDGKSINLLFPEEGGGLYGDDQAQEPADFEPTFW